MANVPISNLTTTWNNGATTFTGVKLNVTDTASASASLLMDLQVGGSSKFSVDKSGSFFAGSSGWQKTGNELGYKSPFSSSVVALFDANFFKVRAANYIGWGSNAASDTTDLILARDAANTLAQRRTTNAQTFRIYNTYTDASNYERGFLRWNANVLEIGAEAGGTGSARELSLNAGAVLAGATNTAGPALTIKGGQGTGTGAGGSIIFQVAPAGSSGTAQNALVDALTIDSERNVVIPLVDNSSTLRLGGSSSGTVFSVDEDGSLLIRRLNSSSFGLSLGTRGGADGNALGVGAGTFVGFASVNQPDGDSTMDIRLYRDAANTLALRNGANAQEQRVYGSYTSATNYQRTSVKTVRESSGALSGASYTTTIAIPAYANLIGVTTRVTTDITGATTYDVGDGSDVDLWGAAIGITAGTASRTADFTAVGAVGAAATSRTITLTANGSNFTGGEVEICAHYLFTEAD